MSVTPKIQADQPLVSCIMPTYNRRRFVPFAIIYFLRQQYSNKELIIIDDGEDTVNDLVPQNNRIRYVRLDKKISLGAKLNLGCSYAQGDIIINWDDDDWYAENRLQYQVNALGQFDAEVCGINNLLYYDFKKNIGYRYVYPQNLRPWLLGSSLCYTKNLWNRIKFADINVGMDGLFVWSAMPGKVKALDDSTIAVHMIHKDNVSPKKTDGNWWKSYPVKELKKIMKNDWHLYNNNISGKKINIYINGTKQAIENTAKSIKNIFACLVHENEECIIDLVRNLHYLDPSSTIILYNGGTNKNLFTNQFDYEKSGAVIHPNPAPVKHGYLHTFALNTMQFALDNYSFECITIVDSDQLAIRDDYSTFLKCAFASLNVGMLSSKPKKINSNETDPHVWPAMQALKEYDLWKPFLQKFKDGESKFVYWTFWPSTVFSVKATKDLVRLFKEDEQLQSIMQHTKIWATEEVILPTLVALLGYDIIANPCSYEFVKYKRTFLQKDFQMASNKTNAYWMHPVNRQYNDALRKTIRKNFNYYTSNTNMTATCDEPFTTLPLLNKLKNIQGWLKDEEADLLIATTLQLCTKLPSPHTIVEVGSYHGKSTIIFGSVLKKVSPGSKIYSIDVHDGKLGAVEEGLKICASSYNSFIKNIEENDVRDMVEVYKDYSFNIHWNKPISLLLIDGLHDYITTLRDFKHFANWLVKDGYVVFHDYAYYFPGVVAFVNELLNSGDYCKVSQCESLIVLKKNNKIL